MDKRAPDVSVVMAVYNGERYLIDAINSILNQTFRDFEFIIINDGSTDGTRAILDDYQQRDQRVRVYDQENHGLVFSLNRACSLAQGRYLARMDADDVALAERLERQIAYLELHPEISLVGGAVELFSDSGILAHAIHYPTGPQDIRDALESYDCFAHPTVVMRRSAFEAVGGYRESFRQAEDYDLWLRMADRYELANLADPVLRLRVHMDQRSAMNLDGVVTYSLVAQAAARMRRRTGTDPLWQAQQVTPELLRDLGVSQEDIRWTLVQGYLWRSELMLRAGSCELALALLDKATEHTRSGSAWESASTTDITHAASEQDSRQERIATNMIALMNTCAMAPATVATVICEGFPGVTRAKVGQYYLDQAFDAYHLGNLARARAWIVQAAKVNPACLRNRGVISILLESTLGSRLMGVYRQTKNQAKAQPGCRT